MSPSPRPAAVRFYVDADLLGLAKLLAQLRSDLTYPGDAGTVIKRRERPPCPIRSPSTPDPEWIPLVAARGWLIVTRDRHIQRYPAEVAAVRDNAAKMVALAGDEARDTWAQLEIVMRHWRRFEELQAQSGPYVYTATRSSLRRIELG